MATKFIILTQVHRPKTSISTLKPPRSTQKKPRKSKPLSENMLNNVFSSKTLAEICNNNFSSHPLTDSILFLEDHSSVKEEGKVSNCNQEDSKSIVSVTSHGDLRREVARLSLLWYMKCSISFILRKARAFYNEFCCDTYVESNNNTMALVDPYFSVPVLPYNN